MSQGNSRTNGIPDRKSNASPNCEHHRDIGHKLSSPSCTCTLPGGITVVQFYASPDGVQFPAEPPADAGADRKPYGLVRGLILWEKRPRSDQGHITQQDV